MPEIDVPDQEPKLEKEQEPDPVQRASQLFEHWLTREGQGEAEPFDELTARHPDLKGSLERLRRMDAFVREAIQHTSPEPISADTRAKMLGDYKILAEVGRGAMGIVFEAEQMSLHRRVALKVLPAHLTLNDRALKRFQHEAEITARLNHRNIISIHQVGEVAGVHFIAMELIEGTSLDKVIERMRRESFEGVRPRGISDVVSMHGLEDGARLGAPAGARAERGSGSKGSGSKPGSGSKHGSGSKRGSSSASNKNFIESAVKLIRQVAEALHHAHQAGVIHRDVKPSNILVRPDGSPVLTDFGLAREDGLPSVSQTGDFAGTPNFVSPEQAMSGRVPVDHRADIFSLGATLYELLTLEQAFPGETIHEILSRIITKQPVEPHKLNPALAPDLVTIVMKALEKDPDRRYASAAEFAADLRSFIEYRPIRAKRTPTMIRAWRWARREPLKAVLGLVLAVGLPTTGILGGKLIAANARFSGMGSILVEDQFKRAFLELGLGRAEEAEQEFRALLEGDAVKGGESEVVAVVGLARSLLNQDRLDEAQAFLAAHSSAGKTPPVIERLRADALRRSGQESQAAAIEKDLAAPSSALDSYVEAMRLLGGTSYARRPDVDARVQARERARRAAALLNDAVLGDTERAPYYFGWAWAAWVAEDPDIARAVAKAIPQHQAWKDEGFAWFYVGVAREVFDEEGALAAYETAARLDPETVGPEALQRRAALQLARDPAQATETFESLVRDHPERADFQAHLAVARVKSGHFEAALEAAEAALALDPERIAAWDAKGDALTELGRPDGACEAFARAIALEPAGAVHHVGLGRARMAQDAQDQALESLTRAVQLDPDLSIALVWLGKMHAMRGDWRLAATLLEDALASPVVRRLGNREEARANQMLGIARNRLGEAESALAAFRRALELAPDNAEYALLLGEQLFELGRTSEMVGPLLVAVRAGLGTHDEHRALSLALRDLQRPEWLEVAKLWTERFDSSPTAWNERAWIQVDPEGPAGLRNPEDGLMAATRAVELSQSRDPGILDTYACALFASGQREKAVEVGRQAYDLGVEVGLSEADLAALEGHLVTFETLSGR